MRFIIFFMSLMLLLTGCRSTHISIDWVDFIKWNGVEYNGVHTGILADEKFIYKKIGEVKFKVADNVSNPNYKIKEGDAAFHEKGTEIFAINGYPNLIAVKDDHAINGYSVYFSIENTEYKWHFKNVPFNEVNRVDIYKFTPPDRQKIKELNGDEVKQFLQLLRGGKKDGSFQPDLTKGDPDYYEVILNTGEPIAYRYVVHYDGTTYFWHPWDTSILSNEIGEFITDN